MGDKLLQSIFWKFIQRKLVETAKCESMYLKRILLPYPADKVQFNGVLCLEFRDFKSLSKRGE